MSNETLQQAVVALNCIPSNTPKMKSIAASLKAGFGDAAFDSFFEWVRKSNSGFSEKAARWTWENLKTERAKLGTLFYFAREHNYSPVKSTVTLEQALAALSCIDSDLDRDEWVRMLTALKTEFGDEAKEDARSWSMGDDSYSKHDFNSTWKSIVAGKVNIETLMYIARNKYGFSDSNQNYAAPTETQQEREQRQADKLKREKQERLEREQKQKRCQTAINALIPFLVPALPDSHPYLKRKLSNGLGAFTFKYNDLTSDARRIYPFNLMSSGQSEIFIPFQNESGDIVGGQVIFAESVIMGGKKTNKINVAGTQKSGSFAFIGQVPAPNTTDLICIGEGYSSANTGLQACDSYSVMGIDAGNLPRVTASIRKLHPHAQIVILGDNDKSGAGQKAASKAADSVGGTSLIPDWIDLGDPKQKSTDWNDIHVARGLSVLRNLLYPAPELNELFPSLGEQHDNEYPVPDYSDYPESSNDDFEAYAQYIDSFSSPAEPEPKTSDSANDSAKDERSMREAMEDSSIQSVKRKLDIQDKREPLPVATYPVYEPIETVVNDRPAIQINQQFLGGRIQEALEKLGVRFIVVKSGMKTGKTTAMKQAIKSANGGNALFLAPRRFLNRALASDLKLNYYEDVKAERDPEIRKEMAKRMACTPQSLVKILADFPDIRYSIIVLDESEAITSMLVSDVVKDKVATLKALKKAAANADNVVLMDAHAGRMTSNLMESLSGDADYGYLVNDFKSWADHMVQLISGGKFDDRVKAANSQIRRDLKRNKRLFIAGSKGYCQRLHETLIREFPKLKIKLITADDDEKVKNETMELLKDPDSVIQFDVVIASSSIAVGVSFDVEGHFHRAFGIFSNNDKTGMPDDSIQHMARPRKLIEKKWIIVLPDDPKSQDVTEVYKGSTIPDDIMESIQWRYTEAIDKGKVIISLGGTNEHQTLELFSLCEAEKRKTKNNFNAYFINRLKEMGCRIQYPRVGEEIWPNKESIDNDNEVKAAKANISEIKKLTGVKIDYDVYQEKVKPILSEHCPKPAKGEKRKPIPITVLESEGIIPEGGKKLTEDEYQDTKYYKKFKPEFADQEKINAMERYRLENRLGVDIDKLKLNPEELAHYLELDAISAYKRCQMREIALSDDEFARKYCKHTLIGADDGDAFKADILSEKHNFVIKRKMFRYALPYIDGETYSHKSLKRSAMVQWFKKNERHINNLRGLFSMPNEWQSKPALLLNKLLRDMGFKPSSKQGRDGKKKIKEWFVNPSDPFNMAVQDFYDKRQKDGRNWVERQEYLMSVYNGLVGYVLTKKDLIDMELTPMDLDVIADAFKDIPVSEHKKHISTYKVIHFDRFGGYEVANQFMREQAEIYREKAA